MTDKQILKKAIEKAIENGYKPNDFVLYNVIDYPSNNDEQYCSFLNFYSMETLIFSHDFAKAFWGRKLTGNLSEVKTVNGKFGMLQREEEWQYHLQQMVLEEDPISYIGRFLDD